VSGTTAVVADPEELDIEEDEEELEMVLLIGLGRGAYTGTKETACGFSFG